jgi:hypothetical protein
VTGEKTNSAARGICIAIILPAFLGTAAWADEGRPATQADLAGKKICWSFGRVSVFAANGQYSNDRGQHSTWSISEPGVIHVGHVYLQTVVLSNGQLQQHKFLGRAGGDKYIWGSVCN